MGFDDPELMNIRADEELDTTKLEPFLRDTLPDTTGEMEIAQFGGGHANLTYLIKFGAAEYVLRRPPLGPVAPSAHDMTREHRVLKDLWRAYPLAPQSFVLSEDHSIIGADFHVMERRNGIVIRREMPEKFANDPDLGKRIGNMLIDSLADLHLVKPEQVGLGELGRPEGFVARQVGGWTKRWHAAKDVDNAEMTALADWLASNMPPEAYVSLLHNDFKLDNMLIDGTDPAIPRAVLDWDMCTRGDPLLDLGSTLAYWVDRTDTKMWTEGASMPTYQAGWPTRDEFVERYSARTGFSVDNVNWYYAFGLFKINVIIQQIYIRYVRGQTKDERFSTFGERVKALAIRGVEAAEI